jgi:hypothetical protein
MLATHMYKTLIDVDQSKEKTWFISPSNVECTIALVPWWNQGMGSRTPPWLHHIEPTMAARHGLGHLLGNSRTCGGRWLPPGASPSRRRLSDEWMDQSPLFGHPMGCIYALGEPWGVLQLALHEIFLGKEGNLVSIKSAWSRFSGFVALPC